MRTALALSVLAATGALTLTAGQAAACDPYRFPYCQTHCRALAWHYEELRGSMSPEPPPWPHTGVAGCP